MGIAPEKTLGSSVLGRRQLIGAAAALVAVPSLAVAAYGAPSRGDSTPAASPGASPAATPSAGAITIEAYEFGFTPSELSVAIGDTIGLFSSGEFPHNFIIEGYNDDEPVAFPADGSTLDWTVPDDLEPGTYTFYCGVGNHRAQGMEGEITVTEAAAIMTLEAYEFGFEPAALTIATGQTLELFSTGEFPHNFIIEGYNDDEPVDFPKDGSTFDWTVPDDLELGTYTFYCGVGNHRAQGMEGEITVTASTGTTVEAFEFGFTPNQLMVSRGDTLSLFSSGQYPHDFKIDGVDGVDVDFPEDGSTIEWTVPDDLAPGLYTFYCSKPGHREQGMEGALSVS